MIIKGNGFTSGQYVAQVINTTTIIASAVPDTTPFGLIEFTITSWRYNGSLASTNSLIPGSQFGSTIS
jgi:hypothetical protein